LLCQELTYLVHLLLLPFLMGLLSDVNRPVLSGHLPFYSNFYID